MNQSDPITRIERNPDGTMSLFVYKRNDWYKVTGMTTGPAIQYFISEDDFNRSNRESEKDSAVEEIGEERK